MKGFRQCKNETNIIQIYEWFQCEQWSLGEVHCAIEEIFVIGNMNAIEVGFGGMIDTTVLSDVCHGG